MEEPIPAQTMSAPSEEVEASNEGGHVEEVVSGVQELSIEAEPAVESSEIEHSQQEHTEENVLTDTTNTQEASAEPEPEAQPKEEEEEEDEASAKARRRISKLPIPRTGGGYGSLRPPASPGGPRSPTSPLKPPTATSASTRTATTTSRTTTSAKPAASKPTVTSTMRKPSVPAAKTSTTSQLKAPAPTARKVSGTVPRATPSAPVKKSSTSQLSAPAAAPTRKPSTSKLTAPTPTVVRKPSGSSLATPTVSRRVSTSQLTPKAPTVARKPSAPQLSKPAPKPVVEKKPAPTTVAPKKSYGALTKKPSGTLDSKPAAASRSVSTAAAAQKPLTPKLAASAKRQVSTPVKVASKPPPKAAPPKAVEEVQASPKKQSLREAIAAARKARKQSDATVTNSNVLDSFNFDLADPFNTGAGANAAVELLKKRISSARSEGRLNISNMELKEVPQEVYKMYEPSEDPEENTRWYESVDLKKLIIADNEIESIGDDVLRVFPDLQSIDAHNNALSRIPSNWDRLSQLSSLNLSNNQLTNDALKDIISITTLVDLKLSKNKLSGAFPEEIKNLGFLEVLEIYQNEIESLPESISALHNLRLLNVGSNQLESVPSLALKECHLTELTLSNNRIKGVLLDSGATEFPYLQTLDIRNNRISAVSEGNLLLPVLQQFYGSNNEMESFPSMEGWNELLTFMCDYNHLPKIPDGMVTLEKLRIVDFTGNSLTTLDPQIAQMDSLEILKLDSNPMKERSFTTMSAADIKRLLKERFAPETEEPEQEDEKKYEIRPGGLLDLSNKGYEEIPADLYEAVPSSPSTLILTGNSLLTIPASLGAFSSLTSLNISHNKLTGTLYLPEKLVLKSLTTLVLNANNISSIVPLVTNLEAPRLSSLDISANRITSITGLRNSFPLLTTLFAQLNQIEEIDVDAVEGMRVLDLSSNSITSLPPKLGNVMTLRDLKVEGNLFKVPRWQILSKGTEAVLSWLRDKIPIEEDN